MLETAKFLLGRALIIKGIQKNIVSTVKLIGIRDPRILMQNRLTDLPRVALMGPSWLWFSGFLAVLVGAGRIPPKIALKHDPSIMLFFYWEIAQQFAVQDYRTMIWV